MAHAVGWIRSHFWSHAVLWSDCRFVRDLTVAWSRRHHFYGGYCGHGILAGLPRLQGVEAAREVAEGTAQLQAQLGWHIRAVAVRSQTHRRKVKRNGIEGYARVRRRQPRPHRVRGPQ